MNDHSDNKLAVIENRLDKRIVGGVRFGQTSLAITTMSEAMEFAKIMALSDKAIRAPFRGNPGMCLAICIQAHEWGLNPYAVASKAYIVNDQVAYESQLIHAVIESRAPLKSRLNCRYEGEGQTRKCIVFGTFTGDTDSREYATPMFKDIPTKLSPLWKFDPDQQLFYYGSRAWCRRWAPDVILGIYAPEEATLMRADAQLVEDIIDNPLGAARAVEHEPQPDHDPETGEVRAPVTSGTATGQHAGAVQDTGEFDDFSDENENPEPQGDDKAAVAEQEAREAAGKGTAQAAEPAKATETAPKAETAPAADAKPARAPRKKKDEAPEQQDAPPASATAAREAQKAEPRHANDVMLPDAVRCGGAEYLAYLEKWCRLAPSSTYVVERYKGSDMAVRNSLGTTLTNDEREKGKAIAVAARDRLVAQERV